MIDIHHLWSERDQALRDKSACEDKEWKLKQSCGDLKIKLSEIKTQYEWVKKDFDNERRKVNKYVKDNTTVKRELADLKKLVSGDNHPSILRQKLSEAV